MKKARQRPRKASPKKPRKPHEPGVLVVRRHKTRRATELGGVVIDQRAFPAPRTKADIEAIEEAARRRTERALRNASAGKVFSPDDTNGQPFSLSARTTEELEQ